MFQIFYWQHIYSSANTVQWYSSTKGRHLTSAAALSALRTAHTAGAGRCFVFL